MTALETPSAPNLRDGPLAELLSTRFVGGLFYSLLSSLVYGLVSLLIDHWVMRDVPLAVNWLAITSAIFNTVIGGMALGALTAWPREGWKGVALGSVSVAAVGLTRAFWQASAAALVFVPLFLPLAFVAVPIPLVLRLAANWHSEAGELRGAARWRRQAVLCLVMAGLAGLAGTWAQMPPDAQAAVRQVNQAVQYMLQNPDRPLAVSFKNIPGLRQNVTRSYSITEHAAATSPTAVEVGVLFSSGYAISCVVDHRGAVPLCFAGSNLFTGPFGAGGDQ